MKLLVLIVLFFSTPLWAQVSSEDVNLALPASDGTDSGSKENESGSISTCCSAVKLERPQYTVHALALGDLPDDSEGKASGEDGGN